MTKTKAAIPGVLPTSPLTIVGPFCKAKPGHDCATTARNLSSCISGESRPLPLEIQCEDETLYVLAPGCLPPHGCGSFNGTTSIQWSA
jgi:hypothetical protein